jgi:hypothetical protein
MRYHGITELANAVLELSQLDHPYDRLHAFIKPDIGYQRLISSEKPLHNIPLYRKEGYFTFGVLENNPKVDNIKEEYSKYSYIQKSSRNDIESFIEEMTDGDECLIYEMLRELLGTCGIYDKDIFYDLQEKFHYHDYVKRFAKEHPESRTFFTKPIQA